MVGLLVIVPASLLDNSQRELRKRCSGLYLHPCCACLIPIVLECRRQKGPGSGWRSSPGDSAGKPAGELAAGATQMVSKAETGHLLWQGPLGNPGGAQRLEVSCCVLSIWSGADPIVFPVAAKCRFQQIHLEAARARMAIRLCMQEPTYRCWPAAPCVANLNISTYCTPLTCTN